MREPERIPESRTGRIECRTQRERERESEPAGDTHSHAVSSSSPEKQRPRDQSTDNVPDDRRCTGMSLTRASESVPLCLL